MNNESKDELTFNLESNISNKKGKNNVISKTINVNRHRLEPNNNNINSKDLITDNDSGNPRLNQTIPKGIVANEGPNPTSLLNSFKVDASKKVRPLTSALINSSAQQIQQRNLVKFTDLLKKKEDKKLKFRKEEPASAHIGRILGHPVDGLVQSQQMTNMQHNMSPSKWVLNPQHNATETRHIRENRDAHADSTDVDNMGNKINFETVFNTASSGNLNSILKNKSVHSSDNGIPVQKDDPTLVNKEKKQSKSKVHVHSKKRALPSVEENIS
mmetsp:Transcript_26583/g.58490  ORF Transcript_26583/g.58490 Transcript_26583/m.58490 type:complete len:271 (+) Transcript_26583:133-945(+)